MVNKTRSEERETGTTKEERGRHEKTAQGPPSFLVIRLIRPPFPSLAAYRKDLPG